MVLVRSRVLTRVQNFCFWSILNSDSIPCTCFCFEPVLHVEPHLEFLGRSWFFSILVLYHTYIFLSLSNYILDYSLDYRILIAMAESLQHLDLLLQLQAESF